MQTRKHVVVVGAGIVGASIAWHLAHKGAAVTVVAEAEGGVATPNSFSWINASWGNPEFYFHFRRRSMAGWRRLAAELPGLPLQWCGALCWDLPPEKLDAYRIEHSGWGYGLAAVGAEEIKAREPGLARVPDFALLAHEEGAVEPVAAARLMLADAQTHGARCIAATATGLVVAGGQATGLVTSDGIIEADTIVLAAGAGSEALAASAGLSLPLDAPAGMIVHSRPTRKRLNGLIIGMDLHMRQTVDGRIIAGSDFSGADPGSDPRETATKLFAGVQSMLKDGHDLAQEFYTVGYRPTPQDSLPIIGESEIGALYFSVMHSGVTLAPLVGDLVSGEVLSGQVDPSLGPFRPGRFSKHARPLIQA